MNKNIEKVAPEPISLDEFYELLEKAGVDKKHYEFYNLMLNFYGTQNISDYDKGLKYAIDVIFTKPTFDGDVLVSGYSVSFYMKMQALKTLIYYFRSQTENDFPFVYSSKSMKFFVEQWEKIFKLPLGAYSGSPFKIYDNQAFQLLGLFGFRLRDNTKKLITKEYLNIEARKQGKSEIIAGLSVLWSIDILKNDPKSEIYYVGPQESSSNIIYSKAQNLISASDVLPNYFPKNYTNKSGFVSKVGGIVKPLAYNVSKAEGQNFSLAVLTEFHLHEDDKMYNSFLSGRNMSRFNQVIYFDTTKGANIDSVAYQKEKVIKEMLLKQIQTPTEIIDSSTFAFIAEIDPDDDERDYRNWYKANPMMNITVGMNELKEEYERVKGNVVQLNEFRVKRLGKWVGNNAGSVSLSDLVESNSLWEHKYGRDLSNFVKKPCYLAVDLSRSNDLTAVTHVFKDVVKDENGDEIENFIAYAHCFLPKKMMDDKSAIRTTGMYDVWVSQGLMTLSGDKSIDYADVAAYIKMQIEKFDVKKILFDPWQALVIQNILIKIHKIPESLFVEVKQNVSTLSAAMELLLNKIWNGKFYCFHHEHTIYQTINVIPSNSNGAWYFSKNKQQEKIDIFATMVTAMSQFTELTKMDGAKLNVEVLKW